MKHRASMTLKVVAAALTLLALPEANRVAWAMKVENDDRPPKQAMLYGAIAGHNVGRAARFDVENQNGEADHYEITLREAGTPCAHRLLIKYTSNSDPNPVTGKQIRLEHDRYLIAKDGKLATIDFSAPEGADNVDQWRLMSNAFSW
jgi:hypothetical protein